jgi:hypothetical protein
MTMDEAEKLMDELIDYVEGKPSNDKTRKGMRGAIISALTAPPKNLKVDVRKVCEELARCHSGSLEARLAAALRAAGCEVVK